MWRHSQHTYLDEPFTQSRETAAEDRLKGLRHGEECPGCGHHPTFPCPLISHTLLLLRAGLATSPLSIPRERWCFMSTTDLIWLLLAWVEKGAEPEAILSLVVRILRVRHARSTFPLQGAAILLLWQEVSSVSSQAHRQKHLESCLKDHRAGHHKGEKRGGLLPVC